MKKIHNISDAKKNPGKQGQSTQFKRDELKPLECAAEGCESTLFQPATHWGRLSAAHPANDSGKTGFVPFQTQVCVLCGTEMDMGV